MNEIASTGISIVFIGLFVLIVGYTKRQTRYGPLMIWAGVTCMLSVIVYYILKSLQ